ncbi:MULTISPECIES: TIGR02587 family membrane protein [unclassified Janibacter]|uniref:TIGR02587 family membrane protein n=1 Tax=unclassified Janibacter TaxID=2649294 RepID=UPI003D036BBE
MTTTASAPTGTSPARAELGELIHAASGGMLFGIPLLYTMEVWWTGSRSHPLVSLLVLVALWAALIVLNKTEGFRRRRDTSLIAATRDAVISLAVGIVLTFVVLVLLRQITPDVPIGAIGGMVVYESVPFCLGIGVARHLLRGSRAGTDEDGDSDDEGGDGDREGAAEHPVNVTLADLGATAIGATFVAVTIAPTDEVSQLAAGLDPGWLIALIGATLVTSYGIVFAAGFTGQDARHEQAGLLQAPLTETVVAYLLSLVVAFVLLWLFQRADGPWTEMLDRVIVLGLPAAIGGAAGRLVA